MSLANSNPRDDDDEFEFLDGSSDAARAQAPKSTIVNNQPYDEAEEVSQSSIDSGVDSPPNKALRGTAGPPPMMAPRPVGTVQPQTGGPSVGAGPVAAGSAAAGSSMGDSMDDKSYDEEESGEGAGESGEDDTEGTAVQSQAKLYNPADFKHLNVSSEIQDLFDYIGRFKPQDIELETKLKPFIPDYIPAVGDIDPFLKVPRPDDKPDTLGLTVLDEPAAHQSDPGVLEQALRVFGKEQIAKPLTVRSIENADKNPKKITSWIQNLEEVHRKKPPPTVNLSKPMPDIFDKLMQIWPADFEQALKETPLPSAEMNMELANYVRVVCALLDIPVYDKLTESLYHLCSLYSAFKSNSHFQQSEPGAMN